MNNQPLVSIITVTKNLYQSGRETYFRQCVASVKEQDYSNIEHIIIDGASTDGTIELFNELELGYYSEPDYGIYDAFNKGIRLSKGKYIAFLNSDDLYISKQAVSLSVKALEESNADFSYANYDIIAEDGAFIKHAYSNWKECFVRQPIGHPTMFSSRAALEELNGFNAAYKIAGDFDLVLRSLLAKKCFVEVNTAFVAFREGGVSNNRKDYLNIEMQKILETNLHLSKDDAQKAINFYFLPQHKILNLLQHTDYFPSKNIVFKNNIKRFLRYIRKKIISIRLQKGKRHIFLFGFNLYNEEK